MSAPDRISQAQIRQQLDLLVKERWARLSLSVVAISLTVIFLPVWVAVLCAASNITLELIAMHYMRALSPRKHPKRHRFVAVTSFFMEASFAVAPVLVWQVDAKYAKAFAVGMICTNLMQMVGVRSIYMPFGVCGLLGTAGVTLIGNAVYWLTMGDYTGLFLSSLAAGGAAAYTFVAMQSNSRLHSAAAQDRAAALDSDRAKSRFLAQMSHELRTPLNAILGMGHAELGRNKDALSQSRLSVLIAAAEGLSTILDDILDLSAIEAGRLPIRQQAVSPHAEIAATLALFQPGIAAAGLALHHDSDIPADQTWMLDPQRLRQCLSNLLSNALKNTLRGGIDVSARIDAGDAGDAGAMLVVTVSDTGQGIPAHFHRTLFDPFVEGRTRRAGTESNGLGLSISRSMARQMGGDLALTPSAPGQLGAQFVLSLRLGPVGVPVDSGAEVMDEMARPDQGTNAPVISGLRVLVVDDIATNRLVASTYLRMLGAVMIEAASGAQALEVLRADRPDLVLLDMNMPEMDGLQTLAHIRALPNGRGDLPIIAMTADALAEHRTLYLSHGLDGYLAKPINPGRIEAEIGAVLRKATLV
jgi:signal transduction histidine kinase/CheY-like chemotaxis protein